MISLYKDTFNKDFEVVPIEKIMEAIMNGIWQPQISYLRSLGKNEYNAAKKELQAMTVSGVFKAGTRSKETIDRYSHLVVLDIDKMDITAINVLKDQLRKDPLVRYSFVSPSGSGIKIIIQVNTGPEHHLAAFLHLQKVFEDKYLLKIDPSGKDICRLCYISWDDTCIINQNSEVFQVDTKYGEIVTEYSAQNWEHHKDVKDLDSMFAVCVKWVERNKTYRDGEKNVYLHALACACNRVGMSMENCIMMTTKAYSPPDTKWHQSVRSAYFQNQAEHGAVKVKDIGGTDFVAPAYVANYTDDVAANDLMTITAMLYTHKVPNHGIMDIVGKIARFYDSQGFIDMRRNDLAGMMNHAVNVLHQNMSQQSSTHAIKYESVDQMIVEMLSKDLTGGIMTYVNPLDNVTGGLPVGNFYGLIGFGETFKSVFAQYMSYMNAMNDVPVLFLNGEMAKIQFVERSALQALGVNFRAEIASGRLNKGNMDEFNARINSITKGNLFVHSGIGFTKQNILSTIDNIYATTGKKIKLVVMDGLGQMDQAGKEEAPANIYNSGVCKEIVKEANGGEGVLMIALVHCSGAENKLIRNTGQVVRGGSKMLANMDGYFSTSLFKDPAQSNPNNPDDIHFIDGKFCLRFADKRGGTGVTTTVVNVKQRLMLEHEDTHYTSYEVK